MNAPGSPSWRVDDDVLVLPGRILGRLPFQTGRESAATPASQIGLLDLVDDLVRAHLEERLRQRGIATERQIVFDARRIDSGVVADQKPRLVLVERHLAQMDRLLAGVRVRCTPDGRAPPLSPCAPRCPGRPPA